MALMGGCIRREDDPVLCGATKTSVPVLWRARFQSSDDGCEQRTETVARGRLKPWGPGAFRQFLEETYGM